MSNMFARENKSRLRVLIYHDVSPENEERFLNQLLFLAKTWNFISTEEFSSIIDGKTSLDHDSLLLTFDDGFSSCRRISESILNPMSISALFFVVSEFVKLSGDDWREFVAGNINPDEHKNKIPEHSVGAHTATHARLSNVSPRDLGTEIIKSADDLEVLLNTRIDHFAYTFGDLNSFSEDALTVARNRFKYIHTGMRGDNASNVMPWCICRDSIKASDSHSLIGAFLEGGADFLYDKKLATYKYWGRQNL
jgi:peptidoglycan/xylan/chitin deacetylase (PgdA/CDA1 family)